MENLELIVEQTEELLCELLLSGFQSVHIATLQQIDELVGVYESYGMTKGKSLLEQLKRGLMKRKNSFEYDLQSLTKAYSQLEFYIASL